jgi:hypothetical protein
MSSDLFRQHLSSADLDMLNGILESAGMRNFDDETRQAARMRAARFLIAEFQQGDTSPATLLEKLKLAKLQERAVSQAVPAGSSDKQHTSSTFGEGAQAHLFEKRCESDKTWAVIEMATGKTARYGSWIMRGLSVQSADRILRTLDAYA